MPDPAATLIVGNVARATATFTDSTGAAADPSVVVATTLAPDGITETVYTFGVDPELTNPAVGTFVLLFPLDAVGHWAVRIAGSGTLQAAAESHVEVPVSPFAVP